MRGDDMKFLYFFKKLFCLHNEIRYWETEEIHECGRKYDIEKYSCMKCGSDFYVRKRK